MSFKNFFSKNRKAIDDVNSLVSVSVSVLVSKKFRGLGLGRVGLDYSPSDCMEKLADEKKMFYIIGDINIDINRTNQNSPQADRYMQVITNNGAFSLITKPTRVTDKTAIVIDHIITNDTVHSILPRVIRTSLTCVKLRKITWSLRNHV